MPSEGGRNLLAKTNQGKTNWGWTISSGGTTAENYDVDGVNAVKLTRTSDASVTWHYIAYWGLIRKLIEPNTKYTLSFDVKPSVDVTFTVDLKRSDSRATLTNSVNMNKATANQWTKVSCVLTSKTTLSDDLSQVVYLSGMPVAKDNYLIIKNIKLEKGETATPYSVAPEDLGWSMTTLVPTQSQRYLWKFEYIYYSDGSVEVTQPVNLSIAGADGTNGQTSHVHFAFADNATGGGFSLTTPKAYMGWYADFNETASNDPTKYKWGKWKGDQGVAGQKGDDGKTSYFHLAYASSADGKTGFSFTESGQQYQGYYTDFTQSSSTDPTKYTWMDRRAGVEVGGRNLIVKSTAQAGLRLAVGAEPYQDQAHSLSDWIEVEPNTTYTLTTYEDVDEANMYYSLAWYSTNSVDYSGWISRPTGPATAANLKGGKHYQTPANAKYAKVSYPTNYPKVKLERGNVATDYNLAPEDVQSDIDSKADQALTQQQLNALAEQNSIVKAEMEAKASIDTVNQWITAYQNYVNANDEAKAESERNLQEASARILQLKTDVGTLRQQWDFIDTYMTVQNEGLIIGKSDGSAYAKFANDRISLFSGSSEVMYISQGVLRIENGIFTKTIQIGRFRFETHPADQDVLVLRYLGG